MNYLLKLYQKYSVKKICSKYEITNYTINPDGTVDVDGNVRLSDKNLTRLPLKFGKVSGHFDCSYNQLTTLEGCPKEVGGYFYCDNNQLTTLEGCPKTVGGDFYCSFNELTTLEGCPKTVGGGFYCYNNPLPKEIIDNPKAFLKQINRDKIINELLEY
jgi:hypothetical protein